MHRLTDLLPQVRQGGSFAYNVRNILFTINPGSCQRGFLLKLNYVPVAVDRVVTEELDQRGEFLFEEPPSPDYFRRLEQIDLTKVAEDRLSMECPICMEDFGDGSPSNVIVRMICDDKHVFHARCIKDQMLSDLPNKYNYPVCRSNLL